MLFAGFTGGRPWILEVTPGGEDTEYENYYAVGSGGTFAKQAMASVAHYDLPKRNLAEAQVIVWRALAACFETAAFGIGLPIWLYSLTAEGARRHSGKTSGGGLLTPSTRGRKRSGNLSSASA